MIKNINKLEGIDFLYPHHYEPTLEGLGFVAPVYIDDNGYEYRGRNIEVTTETIAIMRREISSMKKASHRKMISSFFEEGLLRQLTIRKEIKIFNAEREFDIASAITDEQRLQAKYYHGNYVYRPKA